MHQHGSNDSSSSYMYTKRVLSSRACMRACVPRMCLCTCLVRAGLRSRTGPRSEPRMWASPSLGEPRLGRVLDRGPGLGVDHKRLDDDLRLGPLLATLATEVR